MRLGFRVAGITLRKINGWLAYLSTSPVLRSFRLKVQWQHNMTGLVSLAIGLNIMLISCQQEKDFAVYGTAFTYDQASGPDQMISTLGPTDTTRVTVAGEIDQVCQVKGCWMTLKTGGDQTVRVTFKDYGFFVPMDAGGKKTIIRGVAAVQELDEETARHYAKDAGHDYESAAKNFNEISIVASGVLIERGE